MYILITQASTGKAMPFMRKYPLGIFKLIKRNDFTIQEVLNGLKNRKSLFFKIVLELRDLQINT